MELGQLVKGVPMHTIVNHININVLGQNEREQRGNSWRKGRHIIF